jgi:hypothetical protein
LRIKEEETRLTLHVHDDDDDDDDDEYVLMDYAVVWQHAPEEHTP